MTASNSHEREHKKKNKKKNKKIPSCHFLLTHSRHLPTTQKPSQPHHPPPTSLSQSTLAHGSQYIPAHYSSKTPFVSAYMRPPSHAKRSWFMYFFGPGGIRIPSVVFTFAGRKKHEKAPLPLRYISMKKKNVPMLPLPSPPPSPK